MITVKQYWPKAGKRRKIGVRRKPPLWLLVTILICIVFGGFLWWLYSWEGFRVSSIEVSPGYRFSLRLKRDMLEKNIFTLNLQNIKDRIQKQNPEFKEILVKRRPPDTIEIELYKRRPFLQIRKDGSEKLPLGYILVDREGFVLSKLSSSPLSKMPIVLGMEAEDIKLRTLSSSERLALALSILKEKRRISQLNDDRIISIDVSRTKDASFLLESKVKVSVGEEGISEKLTKPAFLKILREENLDHIRYIDLRFKDVVIKHR